MQGFDGIVHAAVWTSGDGETWQESFRARGASEIGLRPQFARTGLLAVGSRLVGLGLRFGGLGYGMQCSPGQTCPPDPVAVWTSSDGLSWQAQPRSPAFDGATIAAAASDSRTILAVGDSGWLHPGIWITTDGVRWQREALPVSLFRDAHLTDVAAVPGGWILGSDTAHEQVQCCINSAFPDVPAAWYSPDGRHWHRATLSGPDAQLRHNDIEGFGVGAQVITSDVGFVSTDAGHSWQWRPRTLPEGMAASDGQHVIGWSDYPTSNPDTSVDMPTTHLNFFVSADGLGWLPRVAQGDLADLPPSSLQGDFGVVVLPHGLAALNGEGSLWVATAVSGK